MFRNLPLLRRVSRITLLYVDRKLVLRLLSRDAEESISNLEKLGCVFEGGYVFEPPNGEIVGTYQDIELFRLFSEFIFRKKIKNKGKRK